MEPEHYPDDLRPRVFWAGYLHALDDVYDSLNDWNPCHDRVRQWIRARRAEISPDHVLSGDGVTDGKERR